MNNITVILNSFKRPQFLQEQINSINNQTIKPKEIMIWNNNPDQTIDYQNIIIANSNKNLGVWSRFAYALNAKTEYICIFDDDTIPGKKWLENCYETIKINNGLLGTVGLIFNKETYYPHIRIGWPNPNNTATRVDIVGHSWFFKREWLPYLWLDKYPDNYNIIGEDMHFSYCIQKYLNLSTYVPPHPKDDLDMWGSLKGLQYGTTSPAISQNYSNMKDMYKYYDWLRTQGFKILNDN